MKMMKLIHGIGVVLFLTGAAVPTAAGQETKVEEGPLSWDVVCDVFSMPLSEAAKLKRAGKSDAEDYAKLVKGVEAGTVTQEEFLMVRATDGQTMTLEEITQMIYATEYDPPELPNKIGDLANNIEKARELTTPANPTSFETKNVGTGMEVEVVLQDDGAIEVAANLKLVKYLGRKTWGQGVAQAGMPRFTEQGLLSRIKVKEGSASLMGSISPPKALQPKEGEKVVWLAFVTVSKSKE